MKILRVIDTRNIFINLNYLLIIQSHQRLIGETYAT